ncbi:14347_t:CDS:1 [Ambispora leptoticha]|uniref:14347_t:CDS:1 n=1 Tax=Ambispora leptoticha TaxID=144679 RepID=A0A9N9AX75_9GLOM|nr:14347_t:CDS:1 [Ambispora leptoticha]
MSLSSLKTLAYNILKETGGSIDQNINDTELPPCSICNKKILTLTYESFTVLGGCGHIFHRMCIEKKILLTIPNTCPFPKCGKNVELIDEAQRRDSVSSEISGISNLADEFTRNVGFSSQKTSSQDQDVEMDGNEGVEIPPTLPQKRVNELSLRRVPLIKRLRSRIGETEETY